jgi:filamentous hemagglutinin
MRGSLRFTRPAALLVAVLAAALSARASGTITTTGATIDSGNAPAKGAVAVDPDATAIPAPSLPSVTPLGSIGSISGTLPAFVAAGGAVPFVSTVPTQVLPGGTYTYSTFNVPQGSTLTYTGAVTIQTAGDVQIDGLVTTGTPGASITFVCGNNFRIISHAGAFTSGVSTTGLGSPILVDASNTITTSSADGSNSQVDATSGAVTLLAHTTNVVLGLSNTSVRARSAGNTLVQSAGSVTVPNAGTVRADVGDVTVQAYSGNVILGGSALTAGNNLLVEATNAFTAGAGSAATGNSAVTVNAFGGSVLVSGGSAVTQTGGTGDLTVRAGTTLIVSGAGTVQVTGTGDLSMTAFGGGLSVEQPGATTGVTVQNNSQKDVTLRASGDVVIAGTSKVQAVGGNVTFGSTGGAISLLGDAAITAALAIDARGETSFMSHPDVVLSPSLLPSLTAQSLLLRGGAQGIALETDAVTSISGPLHLIAGGDVTVGADLTANGLLTVQSTQGDVIVSGRTLLTGPAGVKSGDVLIESYAGVTGTIDATNATIRSGDDAAVSGDVSLLVHGGAFAPTAGSIVPREVKVKLNRRDATKSRLTANGVLDTGPDAIDLTGTATLIVGNLSFPMTLAADAKGRPTFRGGGVSLKLTPSQAGTSKTNFNLGVTGDFRGFLDSRGTGAMTLRFQHGTLDAQGTVRVRNTKFVRGQRRAALVEPGLYLLSAHAELKDGGKDKVDLLFGFAHDGSNPGAASDVTITLGDSFSVTVPKVSFKYSNVGFASGGYSDDGIVRITVDWRRETVRLRASKQTLGALPPGLAVPIRATVTIGADARAVDFRVAHRGNKLSY